MSHPLDICRDYLSVKVWDLHMESKPIETFTVHEYLRSKLCSLYENDCIFDKFEVHLTFTDVFLINSLTVFVVLIHMGTHLKITLIKVLADYL